MKHGLLRRICILATLLVTLSLAAFAAEGNSFDYVMRRCRQQTGPLAPAKASRRLEGGDCLDGGGHKRGRRRSANKRKALPLGRKKAR